MDDERTFPKTIVKPYPTYRKEKERQNNTLLNMKTKEKLQQQINKVIPEIIKDLDKLKDLIIEGDFDTATEKIAFLNANIISIVLYKDILEDY